MIISEKQAWKMLTSSHVFLSKLDELKIEAEENLTAKWQKKGISHYAEFFKRMDCEVRS